ncbi:hypothetical protein WJX79_004616 [Trebouxia sp. C0005]
MLPATDPADAVTAPLVCYESSSGDEGALQVQADDAAECTVHPPSVWEPVASLNDTAFQGQKNTAAPVTRHLPLLVSTQQAKPGSSDSEGNDASLTAKANKCLHAPQPVEPPPAAVMDTDRTFHVASHTPSDPASASNDIAAPARTTHPTRADMQADKSTHGSAKPPMGIRVESHSAALDTVLSLTKPDAAAQPSIGARVPGVVPGRVAVASVASYIAEPSVGEALSGGGKDLVGRRVEVWWSKDKAFYPGVVKSYNHRKKTHLVVYNDGEKFSEDLRQKKHKLPNVSNEVINPDALSDSDSSDEGASSQQEAEDWELLPANKPPASSASGRQRDRQPAVHDQAPRKAGSGALMPRAATKTRPPTAFRAAAVNATAQEANEGPMRNDNVPVTYSRKKNPAAGEAAAAAVTGSAAHKSVPACGSNKRKSAGNRPAHSKIQDPSVLSQSTLGRRQSRATATNGLHSGAIATGPGPEAAGAPIVTPRAAPSSVSSDAQPKSAASPVPSSGPNINPKSAPISVPSSGPSPVAGTSDPSRAAPTLQAAAPVLPKAASDASPKPLLRAASMSAPSTEPASAVLCSPPRPAPRQTPKPPPTLAEEYAVNPTKATILKHHTALMDQFNPDLESTPGPNFPPAASNTPRNLPALHSAREGSDTHTHTTSQHGTEMVLYGVRSRAGPPYSRSPNQAWKSAAQLHSPGSSASPLPKQAVAPRASQATAQFLNGNEEKKRKGSASMHDAVLPPVLVQTIRQDEAPTNFGALVVHPGDVSSNPDLQSSGPASAAQAAAGVVVPGPRSAEEDALAIVPVAPNSMKWPADVHEMVSRLVFQTNTHNVFRCSEPDGYELRAVLPGMSIDDISVSCQPDGEQRLMPGHAYCSEAWHDGDDDDV